MKRKNPNVSLVENDVKGSVVSSKASASQTVHIQPPKFQTAIFKIRGNAPYVQNKFSQKAREEMHAKHEAGSQSSKGKKRDAKDFKACYENAMHVSTEGWHGIPAPAFRCGMISACRLIGFKMTIAKMSVFVIADGNDRDTNDNSPLVKITKGKPKYTEMAVRNDSGVVDLRARPMWDAGWEAELKIRFDADQFSLDDVANLLHRVGEQVGVGEGRPDSKASNGMGWGTFDVLSKESKK